MLGLSAPGAGGVLEPARARAHIPSSASPTSTGWSRQEVARALPQAVDSALEAGEEAGGKVPVTSGSRGSGREGGAAGGEATGDWCALPHSLGAQWTAGAHQFSSTRRPCGRGVTPCSRGIPAAPRLGTSGWSCRRRRDPAVAGGREEREGDEFQNHSFTPTRVAFRGRPMRGSVCDGFFFFPFPAPSQL